MYYFKVVVVLLLTLLVGACTTLTVQRVEPSKVVTGRQYSLPKPFIYVNPNPNGTMDVSIELLPDSENTYAIDVTTKLAKHDLELVVDEKGFLKKLDWKPTAIDVPKDIASLIETTIQDKIEQKKAELAEEEAEEAAEKSETDTNLEEAEKEFSDAQTAELTAKGAYLTAVDELEKLKSDRRILEYELSVIDGNLVNALNDQEKLALQKQKETKQLEIVRKDEEILLATVQRDRKKSEWDATQLRVVTTEAALAQANKESEDLEKTMNTLAKDSGVQKSWSPVIYEIREGFDADKYIEKGEQVPVLHLVGLKFPGKNAQLEIESNEYKPKKIDPKINPVTVKIKNDPVLYKPESRDNVRQLWANWQRARTRLRLAPADQNKQPLQLAEAEAKQLLEITLQEETEKGYRIDLIFSEPIRGLIVEDLFAYGADTNSQGEGDGTADDFLDEGTQGPEGGAEAEAEAPPAVASSLASQTIIVKTGPATAAIFIAPVLDRGKYSLTIGITKPVTSEEVSFIVR